MCQNAKNQVLVKVSRHGIPIGITVFDKGDMTLENSSGLNIPGGRGKKLHIEELNEDNTPTGTTYDLKTIFSSQSGHCARPVKVEYA